MLVSRRVITSFPRPSLTGGASEGEVTAAQANAVVHTVTGRRSPDRQRSDRPLQLQRSAAGVQTDHLSRPGSETLPHLLQPRPLRDANTSGRDEPGTFLQTQLEEWRPYLDALRLGRLADGERRGGVGSEDVGARGLPAGEVVAIAGVVPATAQAHHSKGRKGAEKPSVETLTSRNSASV